MTLTLPDPKNYKWLNTNSIAKVWEQLSTALDFGIDQLYIVNVGDLKPMEVRRFLYPHSSS